MIDIESTNDEEKGNLKDNDDEQYDEDFFGLNDLSSITVSSVQDAQQYPPNKEATSNNKTSP